MTIYVVNRHTHTPTDRDVFIGRPSPLGNPFKLTSKSTRDEVLPDGTLLDQRSRVINNYALWLANIIKAKHKSDALIRNELNRIWKLAQTGDVYLVCYCAPKACHGDIIKEVIDEKTNR